MPSITDQMKVFRLILFRSFGERVEKMEAWVRLYSFLLACKLDVTRENITSVDDPSSLFSARFQATLESLARCAPDHPSLLIVWSQRATRRSVSEYFLSVATNERTKELFHRGPFIWVMSPDQYPSDGPHASHVLPGPHLLTVKKPEGDDLSFLALPFPTADGTNTERRSLYFFLRNWLSSSRASSQRAVTVEEIQELYNRASRDATTLPVKALSAEDADTVLARLIPKKPT